MANSRRRARVSQAQANREARKKVAKKNHGQIAATVHVSACFERFIEEDEDGDPKPVEYPGMGQVAYNYTFRKLFVDQFGNLIGNAGCSDTFICTQEEIPELAKFLDGLVQAPTA